MWEPEVQLIESRYNSPRKVSAQPRRGTCVSTMDITKVAAQAGGASVRRTGASNSTVGTAQMPRGEQAVATVASWHRHNPYTEGVGVFLRAVCFALLAFAGIRMRARIVGLDIIIGTTAIVIRGRRVVTMIWVLRQLASYGQG
jgi:hypothetical protein